MSAQMTQMPTHTPTQVSMHKFYKDVCTTVYINVHKHGSIQICAYIYTNVDTNFCKFAYTHAYTHFFSLSLVSASPYACCCNVRLSVPLIPAVAACACKPSCSRRAAETSSFACMRVRMCTLHARMRACTAPCMCTRACKCMWAPCDRRSVGVCGCVRVCMCVCGVCACVRACARARGWVGWWVGGCLLGDVFGTHLRLEESATDAEARGIRLRFSNRNRRDAKTCV